MGDHTERLAVFERGEAIEVPPDRIEAELAALWRHAAEVRKDQAPGPVTRACLWNLIIRVRGDAEFTHAKRVVDDLVQRLPARTIVMRAEPDGEDRIRAWVEANWRRPDAGLASGSDEITLWTTGRANERLPSLVRALLYTDAPTAMFWPGGLPDERAVVRELLHQTDRLVVDSRKLVEEEGLARLCRLWEEDPELQITDLSWLGISPLRGLCAALFDPPRDPRRLSVVERVRVTSNIQGTQARALLALGWLASRLGWRAARRLPDQPSLRRWQATRGDGQVVTLELATRPGEAHHGVAGLELQAGKEVWSLTRDRVIEVRGPDFPTRTQPARSHSDAELLSSALGQRGRDHIFREALEWAATLVRT